MGFSSASVIFQQRNEILMLTTGCKDFDDILQGVYCCLNLRISSTPWSAVSVAVHFTLPI